MMQRFLILISFLLLTFKCGLQEVEEGQIDQNTNQNSNQQLGSNSTLPPLDYFRLAQPENIEYQKGLLVNDGVEISKVIAEVKTLKEHIDLINAVFNSSRTELQKIHYGVSTKSIVPEKQDTKLFYTSVYDPIDGYQSKLSTEGTNKGLITWLLQSKLRTDDAYKVMWGGRMDFSNEASLVGVYVFKYRHPDAPSTTPLDVTYRFTVVKSEYQEATDVVLNNMSTENVATNESPSLKLINKFASTDTNVNTNTNTNTNTSPKTAVNKPLQELMSASVEGQIYRKTVATGKPTTYTAVDVKWVITRNITLNSGVMSLNKTTLQMGNTANMITSTTTDQSYKMTWNSDGSGKFERYSVDINALTAGETAPVATTTTCWNIKLQESSCDSNVQLP